MELFIALQTLSSPLCCMSYHSLLNPVDEKTRHRLFFTLVLSLLLFHSVPAYIMSQFLRLGMCADASCASYSVLFSLSVLCVCHNRKASHVLGTLTH